MSEKIKTKGLCLQVPSSPLPTTAVRLAIWEQYLLNTLCFFNCSFPGYSWYGIHSMRDFSEAQPPEEVTLHQREMPEGS